MESIIVQAHPDPDSFCSSIGMTAAECLPEARIINLYRDGFSPVLTLDELRRRFPWENLAQEYISAMEKANRIVFVYPEWWGGPPAILKGFLDRILRPEIAYRFADDGSKKVHELWTHKTIVPVITTDSDPKKCAERSVAIWSTIADFCGTALSDSIVFGPVYASTSRRRKEFLHYLTELLPSV
ncbi:MAG: NAD(P)H-dependent oxidoreductase [Spirochaeta sp.]